MPEHVLGEIGQDQVGRDRRDLVEPRLAELALDVVFLGEAEAAMGLEADMAASKEASAASIFAMLASAPQVLRRPRRGGSASCTISSAARMLA